MHHKTTEAMKNLLIAIESAQQEVDTWTEELSSAKEELFALMEENTLDTVTIQVFEGEDQKVTIVRPTQLKINEEGLQDAVSEAIWRTITKRVIDKKALEDAVTRGKVEAETVSKHSKEVATKPYLRITR